MNPTGVLRLLAIANVSVLAIGVIDAGIGREWDLLVLFALALAFGFLLLSRIESRRPSIPMRRDLVVWLRDRASISGEPVSVVVDRAIAAFAERYGVVADADETRQS